MSNCGTIKGAFIRADEQCKKILAKYNVSAEDMEKITDLLMAGWYNAHKMASCGRALEKMLLKTGAYANGVDYLADYMKYEEEERIAIPWATEEEGMVRKAEEES